MARAYHIYQDIRISLKFINIKIPKKEKHLYFCFSEVTRLKNKKLRLQWCSGGGGGLQPAIPASIKMKYLTLPPAYLHYFNSKEF